MFKLSQSETYSWPVSFEVPEDRGKFKTETFDAVLRRLPQKRIEELMDQAQAGQTRDVDVCKEILTGWDGVVGDDGQKVPYSEGARDQLMQVPLVAGAVVRAWVESLSGSKRKN